MGFRLRQVVDHFRPNEGKFGYRYNTDGIDPATSKIKQEYEEPSYVAAGLFALLSSNDVFRPEEPGVPPVTYGEVTEALRRLINAAPLGPVPASA